MWQVKPEILTVRTARNRVVGPAGMGCAQQPRAPAMTHLFEPLPAGCCVTAFDFKMEKHHADRRSRRWKPRA
jgi:hypothetical protein